MCQRLNPAVSGKRICTWVVSINFKRQFGVSCEYEALDNNPQSTGKRSKN